MRLRGLLLVTAGVVAPAPPPVASPVEVPGEATVEVPIEPPGPPEEPPPRRPLADHVIILSEDGLRPDALQRARAPMHAELMRQGAWSLRARTIRQASTLASHASMLSGFDVSAHGITWNSWRPERGFIRVPTVFTAASAAGKGAAAFVGKRKLEHIVTPGSVDVFSRPSFLCRKVAEQAAAHFLDERPQIEFVHFSDPDEGGHRSGWMSDAQLAAVADADRCLATLVAAVRASGVADRTLLIISSDHGGAGRSHSGAREEDRVIPWIAWGAGVRRNHRIRSPVSTLDTAATALWALGHEPPPGTEGRVIAEAFEDDAAGEPAAPHRQ